MYRKLDQAVRCLFFGAGVLALDNVTGGISGISHAATKEPMEVETMQRLRIEPNPAGLSLGFWASYDRSGSVLQDFGLRPIERVDFGKWMSVERSPGKYTKPDWLPIRNTHINGSTAIINVNTIFSSEVQPQINTIIPKFYPPRITHPKTREAAKKFLRTYVGWLIEEFGTFWLSLDYELFWFYSPSTPQIQKEYRDWYVEAAAIVRDEAARRGASDRVKLVPIVNAEIIKNAQKFLNSPAEGHRPAAWLQDVVAASDGLAVDTYASDPDHPTSAAPAFANIAFWLKHYADPTKPFFVTENGFSTVRESEPDYPNGYHARGTEAQQAEFFKDMFVRIVSYNQQLKPNQARISAYCVWMYTDMKPRSEGKEPLEAFFGLRRIDGSRKPAFSLVQSFYRLIESKPEFSPWRQTGAEDVKSAWEQGSPIPMTYTSGTEHDVLEITFRPPQDAPGLRVEVKLETAGAIVAELNGKIWKGNTVAEVSRSHTINFETGAIPGETNTLRLRFTAERYPLAQAITALKLFAQH